MGEPDIRGLLARVAIGDPTAADDIDALADRLRALAGALRSRAGNPLASPGGLGDKCRMQVVGPDGRVKQTAFTGDWDQ